MGCTAEIVALHHGQLPLTRHAVETFVCVGCREDDEEKKAASEAETHRCAICLQDKTERGFGASMWKRRRDKTRRTLCRDCCHPPCSNPKCKTCTTCRGGTVDRSVAPKSVWYRIGSASLKRRRTYKTLS